MHELSNQMALMLGYIEVVLAATTQDDPRRPDLIEIETAILECARILARAQQPPA